MPWPLMGPGAEPHHVPNLTAYPTAPWPYMVPPAQPYGVPNYPAAHPAGAHPLGPQLGHYAPAVPVMMMPLGLASNCSSRLGDAGAVQLPTATTTTAARVAASAAWVAAGAGTAGVRGATCTCSSGGRQSQTAVQAGQQES
jgi:hypothetical protein